MRTVLLFFAIATAYFTFWSCSPSAEKHPAVASEGQEIFKKNCVLCHGADGKLGLNGAKDLTKTELSEAERVQLISEGKNAMTPFKSVLTADQIKAVAAYTLTFKQN